MYFFFYFGCQLLHLLKHFIVWMKCNLSFQSELNLANGIPILQFPPIVRSPFWICHFSSAAAEKSVFSHVRHIFLVCSLLLNSLTAICVSSITLIQQHCIKKHMKCAAHTHRQIGLVLDAFCSSAGCRCFLSTFVVKCAIFVIAGVRGVLGCGRFCFSSELRFLLA